MLVKMVMTLSIFAGFGACKADINSMNGEDNRSQIYAGKVLRDLPYGSHALQKLDVLFPTNYSSKSPLVFLIHGGAFVAGTKEDFSRPAHIFKDKGFVVINISHRLADTTGMYGFPPSHKRSTITIWDQVADVDAAVQLVLDSASNWAADTSQLFMAGHSAGGTLALLYCHGKYNAAGHLKACGNWAGVTDLTIPDDRLAAMVQPYVRELLYRVAGADPLERNNNAFRKVSPYWVISDSSHVVPTISIYPEQNFVFHYPGESQMGLNNTRLFHELLRKRNIPEKLSVYKGSNHSFNFSEQVWDKLISEPATFFMSANR